MDSIPEIPSKGKSGSLISPRIVKRQHSQHIFSIRNLFLQKIKLPFVGAWGEDKKESMPIKFRRN